MQNLEETMTRLDPFRAWLATVLTVVTAILGGVVFFPRQVYDRFIWRYFWGPIDADAHGTVCSVRREGEIYRFASRDECLDAMGVVAEPGYTTVSTVSYAIVLLLAIVGVYFMLVRFNIGQNREFFFALFPFMLFGGALRVVEDLNVVMLREGAAIISFPWSGLIISPIIYFTVFVIVVCAVLISLWLESAGYVARYEYFLVAIGTILMASTIGWLTVFAISSDVVQIFLLIPIITLGGATIVTVVAWFGIEKYAPTINQGTELMGVLVIWGHAVDGVANVLSLDWAHLFGLPSYTPKHVINRAIVDITAAIQPQWLTESIGSAWPFLFVKIAVAVVVVWIFDESIFDESPRYAIILLVAILAVGIGPGTRDFLRATFGI